jgi:CMP-N-acetylneuraminic acid synthetase
LFEDLAVVIPVRMGSSRIKKKVVLPFDDTNLLVWKINQLKKIISSNNIFISTENNHLKKIALENGVRVHNRDFFLADDHKANFSEVITGIVKDIPFNHIAWITVVVPLMSPLEYENAFKSYFSEVVLNKKFDSLVSVNLLKEYYWNDKRPINYKANYNHTISQDLPNLYRVTNGLYMSSKEDIMKKKYFLGENPLKFNVSKISGIDIDEEEDYKIAKALLSIYKELNNDNSN